MTQAGIGLEPQKTQRTPLFIHNKKIALYGVTLTERYLKTVLRVGFIKNA
jgi:hypothetical protein